MEIEIAETNVQSNVATLGKVEHRSKELPASDKKVAVEIKATSEKKKAIYAGVGVLVVALTGYLGFQSYMYVTTDNALIEAKSTYLSPRVGGLVTEVTVSENQNVKAGQLLAKIRPNDYQNALDQMESDRDALQAETKAAERSYTRTIALLKQGASTQERLEATEAQFRSLERKTKSAAAKVEQAKLDLADTEIKAPADGTIAKRSIELGMIASAGQPVFGFVASDERWATANFKETEMKGIAVGKTATVEVDAISGRAFEGVVESISPSTGATFSLLPPDNATGNFTKVVQRVPVRVRLVHLSAEDIGFLQAGLSAEVRVKLH